MTAFLNSLMRGMAGESLADHSDRQLVERLRAGRDEAAFESVVRRHGPMVYRVCRRILQHAEDAEDAFQATFLLLAGRLGTVREQNSLASWLHGVARRVALKAQSQAAARRRREHQAAAPEAVSPDEVSRREVRAVMDAELAALPEKWRLPLILCHLESRTQEEAARQLGWSRNTLGRRLEEAREALVRRLARRGVTLSAALCGPMLSECTAAAALPARLLASTVEAAAGVASGQAAAALVSAKVIALTEGVVKAMFLTKLKLATAALLLAGLLGAGVGTALLNRPAVGAGPAQGQPNSRPAVPGESDAGRDEAVRQELRKLEGHWKTLSLVVGDQNLSDKLPEDSAVRIKGDVMTPAGNPEVAATLKIDPGKEPREIDLIFTAGEQKGRIHLGIYKLEGDFLTICLANPGTDRPTAFEGKQGPGVFLHVLKRADPPGGKVYDFRSSPSYQALKPEQRQALEQVHRDFVLLWGALDMYAEEHQGRVPQRLEDLVPRYLKDLPRDPFATEATAAEKEVAPYTPSLGGWGYRYRPGQGNSFIVASVGLPEFPYLAEKGNVGLHQLKGLWLSGRQLVPAK
jgi:RNA polymerase sigma factor (sigma-70 family)